MPAERSESYKPRRRWSRILKNQLRRQLHKVPFLNKLILEIWWRVLRLKTALMNQIYALRLQDVDITKTFKIAPTEIKFCTLKEFKINEFRGRVIPGDWDKLEKRFDELDVYVAFEQVFFQSIRWSETIFYQRIRERLEAGDILWGCSDQGDLDRRCAGLEELFNRIRDEGYKSQKELLQDDPSIGREAPEVTISIGRYGDLLFSASAHRLVIAKLLGIPKIPVEVAVRHPEWMRLRSKLVENQGKSGEELSHLLGHPDLEDIHGS